MASQWHLMNAKKRRCSERLLALVAWPNSVRGFLRRSPLESCRCRKALSVSFTPAQGRQIAVADTLDGRHLSWMRRCSLAAQTRLHQHSMTVNEECSCLPLQLRLLLLLPDSSFSPAPPVHKDCHAAMLMMSGARWWHDTKASCPLNPSLPCLLCSF